MDSDIELEQGLRIKGDLLQSSNWLPISRATILYKKALEEGLNVSRKAVKEWLKSQDTFPRYKPIVKKHDFRQTYANYLGEQIQMNLVDMGKYKRDNGGMYWIVTAVEILSRYACTLYHYIERTQAM